MNRDREIDKRLLFLGWTVIHFWGNDILKNTDECVMVIEEAIFDSMLWICWMKRYSLKKFAETNRIKA